MFKLKLLAHLNGKTYPVKYFSLVINDNRNKIRSVVTEKIEQRRGKEFCLIPALRLCAYILIDGTIC